MKKIFNIPNSISLFRLFILAPLAAYFFLLEQNYLGFFISIVALLSDNIDGYIARKFNQDTKLGKYLDAISDSFLLIILAFTFLYLGYINIYHLAFVLAQRFTRLGFNLYHIFFKGGVYNPIHMKYSGVGILFYFLLVPFIVDFFGIQAASKITYSVIALAFIALLIGVLYEIKKAKS